MQPSATDVPALIDRWVAAGIITAEQAGRIRADLATLSPRRAVSLAAEGFGYLGGVIILVGAGLLLSLTWDRFSAAGRTGIVGGVAVALLVGGALVPAARLGTTGPRMRGALWALGVAALFGTLVLAGEEVLGWTDTSMVLLVSGAGTGAVSAVLWAINRHVLQQLATVVPLLVAANAGAMLATDSSFLSSLAVWAVGVVWFALSLPDVIPQRGGGVVGALTATTGGIMMLADRWGPLLALVTVIALVLVAVVRHELPLLVIGSIGTLVVLPFAVREYLPGGTLTTALALVVGGLALVGAGLYTARRRPAG